MRGNLARLKTIFLLAGAFACLESCRSPSTPKHSDILWNIVHDKCVPGQITAQNPSPCEVVTFLGTPERGFVVLKDINGPLQFLLMPVEKISGIESPELLSPKAQNFFFEAWVARAYVVKKYGSAIKDEDLSLAVNSQRGRSQNHLHVHISCLRPEVKEALQKQRIFVGPQWSPLPGQLLGHAYFWRKISADEFKNKGAFELLGELSEAKEHMSEFGLALVTLANKGHSDFVLLADQAKPLKMDRASVEEIQDHSCPQLFHY